MYCLFLLFIYQFILVNFVLFPPLVNAADVNKDDLRSREKILYEAKTLYEISVRDYNKRFPDAEAFPEKFPEEFSEKIRNLSSDEIKRMLDDTSPSDIDAFFSMMDKFKKKNTPKLSKERHSLPSIKHLSEQEDRTFTGPSVISKEDLLEHDQQIIQQAISKKFYKDIAFWSPMFFVIFLILFALLRRNKRS